MLKIKSNILFSILLSLFNNYLSVWKFRFGYFSNTSKIRFPSLIKGIENVYLFENTHIMGYNKILSTKAKFIMKKNSAAAEGLTVVTGTHPQNVGEYFLAAASKDLQIAKDVIIEEDVWIGINVTILAGVTIGRGSIIGAGCVCRESVPQYSIVIGNPSRVVGFKFQPEEILQHELMLYPEEERLKIGLLEQNYERYFIQRLGQIKNYIKN